MTKARITSGKNIVFLISGVGKTGQLCAKECNWPIFLFPPHHIPTLKIDKDLNVRPKTIKILKENIDSNLLDIGFNNIYGYDSSGKGNKSKNKLLGLPSK